MPKKNKKQTVLLCEDEEVLARAYVRKLDFEGYRVVHARDGQESIELAKAEKPDLILLDLLMPIKNGFEVLEELKSDENTKDIKVIVFSNLGQESDVKKCLDAGAHDFVVKSNISLKELVEKIEKYLSE